MHTAHLANVSKSVTKNATFPRTGGLPCLITWQLHLLQLLGDSFSVSQQPPIWDPCSHYSMIPPLTSTNPLELHLAFSLGEIKLWVVVEGGGGN